MAIPGNSFNTGNTSDQLADDSPSTSGIDWTTVAQGIVQDANVAITRLTQPAPYTQLPNGTVITQAGLLVPGTSPNGGISANVLLIVFVLAALVFFIKQ